MICMTPIKATVDKYVEDILDGTIPAGRLVIAACERHLRDLKRVGDAEFPYWFDVNEASDMCEFFPIACRHTKGSKFATKPFFLEPWEAFIVWSMYGWKRNDDNYRRFRYAHISVARKNGKSQIGAGLALIGLDADCEPGAEIYCVATTKDQAGCVFNEAVNMRGSTNFLKDRIKSHVGRLFNPLTHSFCRVAASDRPLDGPNPHYVIFDELHAWRPQHKPFYDTMVTGGASRTQPYQIEITTFGDDQSAIWLDTYNLCKNILEGLVEDETKFIYIASIDDDDDPFDESIWIKANPNLGVSVSMEYMRNQARDAKNKPTFMKTFRSKHLNQITTSTQKAIEKETWAKARGELSDWRLADTIGCGCDLGARDDFAASAFCAKFLVAEATDASVAVYRYELQSKAYMATDTVRDLTKEPMESWINQGYISVSRYPITHLINDFIESANVHAVRDVAYDPYNAQLLSEAFEQEGLKPYSFPQNYSMFNEPIQEFLHLLRTGLIKHDGNPVLAWMANNAVIVKNQKDWWMFDKASSADKIDMLVACVMAFRVSQITVPRSTGSLYLT